MFMYRERCERLMDGAGCDIVLLTDEASMRYVSGFTGEGYVLVTRAGGVVVTDSRYTIAARAECPFFEVVEWNAKGYYRPVMDAVKDTRIKTLGFEDANLSVSEWSKFEKKVSRYVKCKPIKDAAERLRRIKNDAEIELIAQAEAIGDRAFARLMLDLGVDADELGSIGSEVSAYHVATPMNAIQTTEKQLAARLEFYLKDEGGERLSFDTIAASGINGAKPHAVPGDKLLCQGELVTLDFGCVYKGYCSDMTRTIAIGEVSDELRGIYDIVYEAQQRALDDITPGMTGAEIDAIARDYIRDKGYGKYFGHSLGHSVGLKIHESPGFSSKEASVICPGMVISVEPGIYVEGVGGVRIEDLVVITDEGIEDLSYSVRKMLVIRTH